MFNFKKICFVIIILFLTAGTVFAQFSRGTPAWAATKSITLKSSTWFFATNRGTLNYGDEVSVTNTSGNWVEVRSVRNTSVVGWTAASNLSAKRIVVSGSTGGASASEVALAGKGFSQEIEDSYKNTGNYNYADVDRTESFNVSQTDLYRFLTEGNLFTGEER